MKTLMLTLALLLLLPSLPLAAQAVERCVENPTRPLSAAERARMEQLRGWGDTRSREENTELDSLQRRLPNWDIRVGVGNGWITDGPDSCVLYVAPSGEPVLGTRVYLLAAFMADTGEEEAPVSDEVPADVGRQAVVTSGPARIRSGPGLEHPRLRWCNVDWPLTVWPPAQNGWLRASCYGANGWIHESLVQIGEEERGPDIAPPAVSDEAPADGGQEAVVTSGPARIRSGPGTEHPRLRWCNVDWPLTVWPPAQNGWLRASCFGANGWIHESLVQIGEEEREPDTAPPAVSDEPLPPSGQPAVVTTGPAHIRSGPGEEHLHLRWCGIGWSLTVWPPAQNGWLRASCYGAIGWIHESLVQTGEEATEPEPAPAAVSDEPLPPSGQPAVVTIGPAHIRSGPGEEHPHVRWCGIGWSLTVWPPAQNGWLRASCYGANGWIHETLVSTG